VFQAEHGQHGRELDLVAGLAGDGSHGSPPLIAAFPFGLGPAGPR
jgi:hypothetical protein